MMSTLYPYTTLFRSKAQVNVALAVHQQDLQEGYGAVYLPFALERKYPMAATSPPWQYGFPSPKRALDPRSSELRQHHLGEQQVRRAVAAAVAEAGIRKHASGHTFRHSFATDLLRARADIRNIPQLLGHEDINTTMIYTHVVGNHERGLTSPLDR